MRMAKVFHIFAVFCDQQYNNPAVKEEMARVLAFRGYKKTEMEGLSKLIGIGNTQDNQATAQHLEKVKKLYNSDDFEYKRLQKSKQSFLENSAKFYLQAAIHADRNGEDISSFIALWFGNVMDAGLNKAIESLMISVPACQLVPWINQLSSRLGENDAAFTPNLESIVLRVCESHPHHSLYPVIGLRITSGHDDVVKQRTAAGNKIWSILLKNDNIRALLKNIETFSTRSISVAHQKVAAKTKKWSFDQVPKRSWWMETLPTLNFPPPTLNIPIRPDGNYVLPSIVSVEREIAIASGLSAPKIIRCTANDGNKYTMLLKGGKDDLRQDAIMEQVFGQVNLFFSKNSDTRSRRLSIRTYKVIPLGSTGGIIEFVQNTLALMDYLQPAHKRYRPKDWDAAKAREMMKKSRAPPSTAADRYEAYLEIEKHVHPVLHMFFLDHFYSPEDWFTNRIRYIRSTAAISMLGYVLGVGDRHCNNILLDTKSGEVVHIDLGISFDQVSIITSQVQEKKILTDLG